MRLIVAPGDTAFTVQGATMDGQCFSRGPNAATRGGKLEILLGAATAAETSRVPSSNLALWDVLSGLPQATVGLLVGPPADLNLPSDLSTLSREEILALGERATMPGFGRAASVTGTAEGIGFENDPFLLAILAGQPFGEAMRPGWDEPQILYGDPTFHL